MWYDFEAAFESKKSEAEEMLHDEDKLLEFISKVLKKLDTIPVVGSLLGDIPLLCMIVVDYFKGEYTEIPLASVIGIIAALIYFFSPVDLIPDCIPGIGLLDDAAVIGIAIKAVDNDLQTYREWKGM